MRIVTRRLRIPRLWKLTALMTMSFMILAFGLVYATRTLPHPGCIFLSNSQILDLLSGRTIDNTGWQESSVEYLPAPDSNGSISANLSVPTGELTIYLWPDRGSSKRMVLQEGVLADEETGTPNFTWSSDGQNVAYLWRGVDSHYYLSAGTGDGSKIQTVPFSLLNGDELEVAPAYVFGWSADKAYVVTSIAPKSVLQGSVFRLWALPDLRPVATPLDGEESLQVAWSPQGHRFGAVIRETNSRTSRLILITPDEQAETVNIPLPHFTVNHIFWSPDGSHLTLAYLEETAQDTRFWRYDIYSAKGEPLFIGINAELADFLTSGAMTGPAIRAAWSPDGKSWVYLKERGREEQRRVDLMALDVETGMHRITAPNLVTEFLNEMFLLVSFQSLRSYRPPGLSFSVPRNDKVIIPRWQDGKITVESADITGDNRKTLIQMADALSVDSEFRFPAISRGWLEDDSILIAWEQGEGEARRQHLTVVEPDGNPLFTSDGYQHLMMSFIRYPNWVTYLGGDDSGYRLYLYNIQAQELHTLVGGLEAENGWQVLPIDDSFTLLVLIYPTRFENRGDVYYVTGEGQPGRLLAEDVEGFPAWSPDGKRIGILQRDQLSRFYLELLDTEDYDVTRVNLRERIGANPSLVGWSYCEV